MADSAASSGISENSKAGMEIKRRMLTYANAIVLRLRGKEMDWMRNE